MIPTSREVVRPVTACWVRKIPEGNTNSASLKEPCGTVSQPEICCCMIHLALWKRQTKSKMVSFKTYWEIVLNWCFPKECKGWDVSWTK